MPFVMPVVVGSLLIGIALIIAVGPIFAIPLFLVAIAALAARPILTRQRERSGTHDFREAAKTKPVDFTEDDKRTQVRPD